MLWSLPADGSCKSLMEDDAEIWPSFMNLDFIPSGDKQPTKIKKTHRYSHNDTGRFLFPPQRLPLSIPIKMAIHRKIKSPRGTMGRGKRLASSLFNPFPIVLGALSVFLLPGPNLPTKRPPRPQCFSLKNWEGREKVLSREKPWARGWPPRRRDGRFV